MMSSDPAALRAKAASTYHHGDLRAALVSAARHALETTAPEAITLKSLAVSLGVSQPAPYRHFHSREALMVAVAADGFARFGAAIAAAAAHGPPDGALERACLAYIAFGRSNLGVYHLMFASSVLRSAEADSLLQSASQAAFAFLLEAISRIVSPDDAVVTAVSVWSTLHGVVMLDAEGLLSGPIDAAVTPERIVHVLVERLRGATSYRR